MNVTSKSSITLLRFNMARISGTGCKIKSPPANSAVKQFPMRPCPKCVGNGHNVFFKTSLPISY